jgi:hypothetical protein
VSAEIANMTFLPTLFGAAFISAGATGSFSTKLNLNVAVNVGCLLGFIGSVVNEIPGTLAFPVIGTIGVGTGYGLWFWSSLTLIRTFTKRALVLGIYFGYDNVCSKPSRNEIYRFGLTL